MEQAIQIEIKMGVDSRIVTLTKTDTRILTEEE